MTSLFPGMDPYLEQPTFWSSFHFRLIGAIAAAITPQLGDQYQSVPPLALPPEDRQWLSTIR
jgi:Protein of unknown function (DUF4058)